MAASLAQIQASAPALVISTKGKDGGLMGALGKVHSWVEINPAAKAYVAKSGLTFRQVYPHAPSWSSKNAGSKDVAEEYAKLVGQDFNTLYHNRYSKGALDVATSWVGNVVKTAGRPIAQVTKPVRNVLGTGVHLADQATGEVGNLIGKIPVIGTPLRGIYGFEVQQWFRIADSISKGDRIDQVALKDFKQDIHDIHDAAPLVQTVISLVPGIGPVASGAISAAIALAEGEPITDVMLAAAAGSIPGGALVQATYKAGVAVITNKGNVGQSIAAALNAAASAAGVPLPSAATQVIDSGLGATVAIARGQKPDAALMQAAITALPAAAKGAAAASLNNTSGHGDTIADTLLKTAPTMIPGMTATQQKQMLTALGSAIALGHANVLQSAGKSQLAQGLGTIAQIGAKYVVSHPITQAAKPTSPAAAQGFDVGAGVAQHTVTPFQVTATRSLLPAAAKPGYDAALSLHVARVTATKPPPPGPPKEQAGALLAKGLRGASPEQRAGVLGLLQGHPLLLKGAQTAAQEIALAQDRVGWWFWLPPASGAALGGMVAGWPWALAGALGGAAADFVLKRPEHRGEQRRKP
jgi:hypothetical protein